MNGPVYVIYPPSRHRLKIIISTDCMNVWKKLKNKIYINGKIEISKEELFFPIARSEKRTEVTKNGC
jgi:hypothetical protein